MFLILNTRFSFRRPPVETCSRICPLVSVPVLHEGSVPDARALKRMVDASRYKSDRWQDVLREAAGAKPHRPELVMQQTDPSGMMEGLYIKVEDGDRVSDRYKYVRHDFLSTVLDSNTHWHARPILQNHLAPCSPLADL